MANKRVILCGGLSAPASATDQKTVQLDIWGPNRNITMKSEDIGKQMVVNIPDVLADLLEIATYIHCADQATSRGKADSLDYGAKWRRHFQFHIPVRLPAIWSSEQVRTALCNTLAVLSEDTYEFTFKKVVDAPPVSDYFDFGKGGGTGFQADEVVLFSGGLDSLAGAVQECIVQNRKVVLVSHRSSSKIHHGQQVLREELNKLTGQKPLHISVWIHHHGIEAKDYTQRARSFLYASLGVVIARLFELKRIRFYENGVISLNLPVLQQVVGSRATRTTHPQVIDGFSKFFSAVFQNPFTVENPFLWKTKTEVVRSIRESGGAGLIKNSVSCTHTWERTVYHTHCGICSQCIDRRFATLSAGCSDEEDPEEMYEVDLLTGERKPGVSRTMAEAYALMAKRIAAMSELDFFTEFGETSRIFPYVRGMTGHEAAMNILDLYKRHALAVCKVLTKGIQDNAEEIQSGSLPDTCLLILSLTGKYKIKPSKEPSTIKTGTDSVPVKTTTEAMPVAPQLILDEIRDGEVNRTLLARILGFEDFDGVNKKIGSRELFFTYLLFNSTRSHNFAGEHITVVSLEDLIQELLKWSEANYLRFTGKDLDKPGHRIQKMWREFVHHIGTEKKLRKLFTDAHKVKDQKVYGVKLRPEQTQIRVPSIPALFQKASEKSNITR